MSTCPQCGEEYSPQGMYGHLRMGHGLSGDDLEETYQQTQEGKGSASTDGNSDPEQGSQVGTLPAPPSPSNEGRETAEDREPVQKAGTSTHGDRVTEAADRLRRAKQRLQEVEAKTGEEVKSESPKGSGAVSRTILGLAGLVGLTNTETTVDRTEAEKALCRECREEVQAAERELEKALEHEQVNRRYARADT